MGRRHSGRRTAKAQVLSGCIILQRPLARRRTTAERRVRERIRQSLFGYSFPRFVQKPPVAETPHKCTWGALLKSQIRRPRQRKESNCTPDSATSQSSYVCEILCRKHSSQQCECPPVEAWRSDVCKRNPTDSWTLDFPRSLGCLIGGRAFASAPRHRPKNGIAHTKRFQILAHERGQTTRAVGASKLAGKR